MKKTLSAFKPTLGAVIINYRTPEDSIRCAESLIRYKIASSTKDIVIVNNPSGDDSTEIIKQRLPQITVVNAPTNGGFGSGVNIGVERCAREFIAVLNPDTVFFDNSLSEVFRQFKDPKVGIVGFNLVNEDGSPQHSARTFYSFATVILRRTPLKKLSYFKKLEDDHLLKNRELDKSTFEAPWVLGAGFVVRRSAFVKLGGMDERFFLYLEDTDICRRMWRAGYKVCVAASAKLMHVHRRESANSTFSNSNKEHLKSLVYYISKYGLPIFGHDRYK